MDLDRLAPTLDLISRVELRHKHTPQLRVLLTKVRAGTNSSVASRLVLKEDFKLPVLEVEIPLLERFANAMGLPVTVLGEYREVMAALREKVA
jgi:cellulose biosynthesis protein BcsQ